MLGHREMTIQDYTEILKRRFWLILICGLLLLGVGLGINFTLPPQYVSQTLVIVEQQKVPENYVKPVVTEDLNARLASMKEQILSRSRLEPIIERFNLFTGGNATMDDRVDATRRAIQITPIGAGANKVPGFYISFKARNARTAQQVCSEITSLFVSESLHAREQSAEGTTAFLSQQVTDAKRALDEQDAKLAAFQTKYIGKLPDQEQSNLNALQALTSQLDAATQSLNRMQQDETFIQAVISQQSADLQRTDANIGVSVDTLETKLKALIAQKKELENLYTSDHPDVVALSRKIADLQAEIAQNNGHPASGGNAATVIRPDPPQLQQAKAQLRSIQQSIAAQKQVQARIEEEIRNYQSRIESSPLVEQEFKQITRDHEAALQFYNNLLSKTNESTMATNLERRQQGEQFQVLDAANLPDSPVFPNPFVFAGGGFVLGVLLGLGIAAILEYRDTSLRTARDIWTFTKLPTLATISYIEEIPRVSKKRKRERRLFNGLNESTEDAN
jgi:polysaccharide chain length determinant protein (PEP-CTERM system associated)